MNTATYRNGCHNRKPFVAAHRVGRQWIPSFGAPECQYTLSALGQQDKGCIGCKHKKEAL